MTDSFRRALYGVVVFWSACLLLLVQPIITKAILPWFGGSAGVWTTSMLFFQTFLLLGYFYAHLLNQKLSGRAQVIVHCVMLVAAVATLPLRPSATWKPDTQSDPVPQILGLLFTTAGLPYLLLSTTSPLMQAWFTRTFHQGLPWRLFAVSNLGSLCALLSYPVLIEPNLTVRDQLNMWSIGFVIFVVLCGTAAALSWRESKTEPGEAPVIPSVSRMLKWMALAMVPSILWLAVANQLSQDVAAIPFLWVLPLSLYLLSFVFTFDSDKWYRPAIYKYIVPAVCAGFLSIASHQLSFRIGTTIMMYAAVLFLCCMFCHGELARQKPETRELTSFYLTISAGGALGGIFVGIIAPRIFNEYFEMYIGVLACGILALWFLYRLPAKYVLLIGSCAAAGTAFFLATRHRGEEHFMAVRNFYGTLQIQDWGEGDDKYRILYNGPIQHGVEYLVPEKALLPTSYYGPGSGAGLALKMLQRRGPVRVGVIGLGAGTMAAYTRPGDYFRFYEINPEVIRLANTEFRYIPKASGPHDVVLGDARLSLEREEPQNFDFLAVDAFSGDSIPIHLMTREAFAQYFRHLRPGGVLAVHVTNRHLDLAPVAKLLAGDRHATSVLVSNDSDDNTNVDEADWVIITTDESVNKSLIPQSSRIVGREKIRLWTDDYSNLFSILK